MRGAGHLTSPELDATPWPIFNRRERRYGAALESHRHWKRWRWAERARNHQPPALLTKSVRNSECSVRGWTLNPEIILPPVVGDS
jgi:hypothetical protein